MFPSQAAEIFLQIFIIQSCTSTDHKRKACTWYVKASQPEKRFLSALRVFSQNLHKFTTNHNVNRHASGRTCSPNSTKLIHTPLNSKLAGGNVSFLEKKLDVMKTLNPTATKVGVKSHFTYTHTHTKKRSV